MTTTVAFRLDDALNTKLARAADLSGQTRTDVMTTALREYLYRLECERDLALYKADPSTIDELAMRSTLDPDGTDWSEFFE